MNRWLSPIAAINADIEALFMSRSSRSLLFSYYLVCFVRVLGKETGTGADNCPGTPTRGGGCPYVVCQAVVVSGWAGCGL